MDIQSKIYSLSIPKYNVRGTITLTSDYKFKDEDLNKLFKDLISDNMENYSGLYIDKLIHYYSNYKPYLIYEKIVNELDLHTNNLNATIQNKLDATKFKPSVLIDIYNDYKILCNKICKLINYYSLIIKLEHNISLTVIFNFIFYNNVINKKYEFKSSLEYLYIICNEYFSNSEINIKDILKMHSISKSFNKLSNIINDPSHVIINTPIDSNFLTSLGDKKEFIKTINMELDKSIKSYNIDFIDGVVSLIEIIKNKNMFMVYYKYLLQDRLLKNTNFDIDHNVFKKLHHNFKNNIMTMIKYMFIDLECEQQLINIYKTNIAHIKKNDKYKKHNYEPNYNIFNPKILRKGVWSNTEPDDDYILTPELFSYTDTFKALYNIKYEHRKLNYCFNLSTSICKIPIGKIAYNVEMNMYQTLVALQFNNKMKLSFEYLMSNTKLQKTQLQNVINSFIESKLMKKTDDNKYCFNMDYKNDNLDISIINYYSMESPQKITIKIIKNTMNIIRTHKELSYDDLYNKLTYVICVQKEDFKLLLNKLCEDEILILDNDKYRECDDSDSDSDSD